MTDDYEAPDSDFYGAPEHQLHITIGSDMSLHELKGSCIEPPPSWLPTPSGRKQTTMEDFLKTHFPNGMYIPGYMLHKRD